MRIDDHCRSPAAHLGSTVTSDHGDPNLLVRGAKQSSMNNGHAAGGGAIPSLDGLRAVSVLLVLAAHAGYGHIVPGGFGVTIFFFLSGYLITTLLVDEVARTGRINVRNFYLRRSFRLFPPLVITLIIAYSLVAVGLLGGHISLGAILAQLLYFANYYGLFFDPGNSVPAGTGILWSLAVEEHFYMFYPAVMVGLLAFGFSKYRIAAVLAVVCVVVLLWRIYLVAQPSFDYQRTYFSSDTRVDSIIYGCLLALVANPVPEKWRSPNPLLAVVPAGLLAIAVVAIVASFSWQDTALRETYRYSLHGLALMPVFYFSIKYAAQFPFTLLNHPWIAKIGVYSYAMYLIHHVVINFMEKSVPWLFERTPLLAFATFLIAIAYAALLDVYVDSYFRRLRKKFR